MSITDVVGSVLALLGASGVCFATVLWRQARASALWPQADGQVEDSRLVEHRKPRSGPMYRAHVVYSYDVRGQRLRGSRVSFGDFAFTGMKRAAEQRVRSYPAGARVTVYYDPYAPERSVLQPGSSHEMQIILALSVVLLVLGTFLYLTPLL